jgi:hypothetical protein
MTVYVDELRDYYRVRGTGIPGLWCHMVTDGEIEELHEMARRIGISPRRFQNNPRHPHYDLLATSRALALACGAQEITTRQLYRILSSREHGGSHTNPLK